MSYNSFLYSAALTAILSAVPGLVAAQSWQPIPMVSQATLDSGISPGGDGAQWPRDIAINEADPNFMLMVTDVGGIYRSTNGGGFWQVTMTGWNSRGGWAIAMDPKNGNRALVAAFNARSYGQKANGLYLTTDKGASWTQVYATDSPSSFGSLAIDESSYDSSAGYCKIAYWLNPDGGISKSTDGGSTWSQVNSGYSNGNTRIKVHPTNGHVYLASNDYSDPGFYRSTDGGQTFTQINGNYTWGIDVVDTNPDNVYLSRYDWVVIYNDATGTVSNLGSAGLPGANQPFQNVAVSPANPKNIVTWADLGNYNWVRYYTNDGGNSWGVSNMGNNVNGNFRQATNELLPYNVRQGVWAWSPTDANTVFSFGGDWITESSDAGANFTWAGNGYNAVFTMPFNFSPSHPDTFMLATKDYNSYHTTNGGTSWTYDQVGFDFGGYNFGAFSLDGQVLWVGDDPTVDASGDPLLKVSLDGGQTWALAKDSGGNNITVATNANKFSLVSAGDPANPNVGFIGAWRTTDKGQTWSQMNGVDMVYTYNPQGSQELYGRSGNSIVTSTDDGNSWQVVATYSSPFIDLAYDYVNQRFWLVSQDQLVSYQNGSFSVVNNLPTDQYGTVRVGSVAVDPAAPNVVYAVNHRDIYYANNSVVRSTDGGATWTNLTITSPLPDGTTPGGPHEGFWVRVRPDTRDAWVGTNCFGLWKIAHP